MMLRSSVVLLAISMGLAGCGGGGSAGSSALPQSSTNSSSVVKVPVSKYKITLTNYRGPSGPGLGGPISLILSLPETVLGDVTYFLSDLGLSSSRSVQDVTPSPAPTGSLAGITVTATDVTECGGDCHDCG